MGEQTKNSTCRVCLQFDIPFSVSVFEELENVRIADKITSIAKIEIKEGDGFPDRICFKCLSELQDAVKFKLKCEKSNTRLLSALPLRKTKNIKLEFYSDNELFVENDGLYGEDCTPVNIELKNEDPISSDVSHNNQDNTPLSNNLDKTNAQSTSNFNFECNECGMCFKSKCKMSVHWKKTHLLSNLVCPVCKRVFKSYKAYNRHTTTKTKACINASQFRIEGEGNARMFYCTSCSYATKNNRIASAHIVVHSGERPYACDKCPKRFSQFGSMQSHKESVHKQFLVEATCQYCGKFVRGRNRLYKHLKWHEDKTIKCHLCNNTYKNANCLKIHLLRHKGVRSYACEICGAAFTTSSGLSNHKNRHNKEKRFKCDICSFETFWAFTFKRHKAKHTSTNAACNICGLFVENEKQLALHKIRHTDRRYPCNQCDKTFFTRKSRSAHNVKKHKCSMLTKKVIDTPNSKSTVDISISTEEAVV